MKTIFVFAYYSLKDPVFQSAVLPYLKVVKNDNLRFILLTWEQRQFQLSEQESYLLEKELKSFNIIWKKTKWHSGHFKLIKKAYDLLVGISLSIYYSYQYKVDKIYSEGFPGAIIGYSISKLTRIPHIIHTFEPHADYMSDAGVWNKRNWEYRLIKNLEIQIGSHAQEIITATKAYREILIKKGLNTKISVIPSCIDDNTYKFLPTSRKEIREQLGITKEQTIIVYLGKLGGMYMDKELFEFFNHCMAMNEEKFYFMVFTNTDENVVTQYCTEYNIPKNKVLLKYLSKDDVPAYLSAADIAFCGVRNIPSQRFSSPIKNGEYWACGLPLLILNGISDDYIHVKKHYLGIVYDEIKTLSLDDINRLNRLDRYKIAQKSSSLRSLEKYKSKFTLIFEN